MSDILSMVERVVSGALRKYQLLVELVDDVSIAADRVVTIGAGRRKWFADEVGRYGFYSRPPKGADGVVIKVGGEANTTILLGYRHRDYELELSEDGELGIADDQGQKVVIKRDGIYVDAEKVVIKGGTAGAVRVGDRVDPTNAFTTWLGTLVTAINGLAPGTVSPYAGGGIGQAAEGSTDVKIG